MHNKRKQINSLSINSRCLTTLSSVRVLALHTVHGKQIKFSSFGKRNMTDDYNLIYKTSFISFYISLYGSSIHSSATILFRPAATPPPWHAIPTTANPPDTAARRDRAVTIEFAGGNLYKKQ